MTREEFRDYVDFLRSQDEISYDVYSGLINGIDILEQEPSRDIKEIAEIMKCDADAETKCKMVSNILTAKPHYFEEQEPRKDAISRRCNNCAYYVNGANDEACDGCFADEYEHPNFKPKAQPCKDCISRQEAINAIIKIHPVDTEYDCILYDKVDVMYVLKDLPPVIPQEKVGHWIPLGNFDNWGNESSYECSKCGDRDTYPDNYCPNCGVKMIKPHSIEIKIV